MKKKMMKKMKIKMRKKKIMKLMNIQKMKKQMKII